jgi:hypothetical protein
MYFYFLIKGVYGVVDGEVVGKDQRKPHGTQNKNNMGSSLDSTR